jgi:hypothetical protein
MVPENRPIEPTDMTERPRIFLNLASMKCAYLINFVLFESESVFINWFYFFWSEEFSIVYIKVPFSSQINKFAHLKTVPMNYH